MSQRRQAKDVPPSVDLASILEKCDQGQDLSPCRALPRFPLEELMLSSCCDFCATLCQTSDTTQEDAGGARKEAQLGECLSSISAPVLLLGRSAVT